MWPAWEWRSNISTGADTSINDNFAEYDDTDLLSKMFTKDHNRSGILNINEGTPGQNQVSLSNKNDKSRY